MTSFGGSFPIPEDWRGGEPDFEGWFVLGLQCNPLANDTDPDGDPMSLVIDTPPAHGEAVVLPDGFGVAYDPDEDFSTLAGDWVSDTITYHVTAGGESSNQATIRLWVAPINDPPSFSPGGDVSVEAADGPYSGAWAAAISPGPSNEADQTVDFVVELRPSDYDLFTTPPAIASDGTLTFTPVAGANGTAQATVWAVDDGGTTNVLNVPAGDIDAPDDTSEPITFSITIEVGAVNDPPVADDETLTVAEDAAATAVPVLTGDTDPDGPNALKVTAVTNGSKGTVAITGGGTGLTYKPGANKVGTDTFTYTVSDGLLTDTATVSVTITPVQDVPTAINDKVTLPEGAGATAVNVLGNDLDLDGDVLKITSRTNGAKGVVAITGGGTGLTYDPGALQNGTDTFTYTVSDGKGGTDSATVVVTITPDTAVPVIVAPSQRLPGQTLTSNATNTVKAELAWSGSDPGSGVASYQLQVSVDGGAYSTISLATATTTSVQRTLTFGRRYQFRVRATDRRGNRSGFAYGPTLTPGRHQENSTLATYVGTWTTSTNADMSGGKGRWASAATARTRFTFTGRDIAWVATRTTTSGRAQVWVDGVLITTVSLRSDPVKHRQIVFSRHWPSVGTHTVEIRPLGDGRVYIDAWVALR